ncbi:hypothetical protein BDF22DRAFT_5374 [Syncephalis plumigaleata]|nr:hypothetical protein BDF22DRAFT_5374 [Syncephalis plumigaleata]
MFIRDLSIIKRAIQSRQWTIILPLAVIIELDGLRKSESALGVAAREALAYLEAYFATPIAQRLGNESETLSSTMSASSLPVRVQTAKGNYLPNIQYRSESFHREDDADRWGDYSSKDNDEMTATVMMTTEENELHDTTHQHQHQQHSILNQSSTKTLDDIILEVCQLHPPRLPYSNW